MTPPGGKSRIGTTNCISGADGNGKTTIHFDQSTTAVALGETTMAKAAGEKYLCWALDKNGKPTTNARLPYRAL